MRRTLVASLAAGLFGCSSSSASPGGAVDAAIDAPRDAAPPPMIDDGGADDGGRTPFPPIAAHAGKVLASPSVVTITYSGYEWQTQVEKFGNYVVTSEWLATVGADYGVRAGSHQFVRLADPAPDTMTDGDVRALLGSLVGTTLPTPDPSATLYMLYVPKTTTVTHGATTVCGNGPQDDVGYHAAAPFMGHEFAYAVIGDCASNVGAVTATASHELIEAATDPYDAPSDGWYMDAKPPSPWWGAYPNEVGDLCQRESLIPASSWTVQRIWSLSAAAAGGSPCIPVPPGEVYFNVTAHPAAMPKVPPGGSFTFTLLGWATAPHDDWQLSVDVADRTDFDPHATLAAATMNDGRTTQVTLTAPASAASGRIGIAYVYSGIRGHFWPVGIQIE